jgi:hypothetical protein
VTSGCAWPWIIEVKLLMQLVAMRHALNGLDLAAFGFRAQHQAGTHQPVVEDDAAGAAVAGAAAFLGAGETQPVAQHVQQRLVGLAQILDGIAVDRR